MSDSTPYQVPEGLFYTREHEWTRIAAGTARVGITDYAAKTLNDIVYLTLPAAPKEVNQFNSFGTVESIKAVSELYAPLSGTIISVNKELVSHPELINKSPYDEGWIIELQHSKLEEEKSTLLSASEYLAFLHSLDTQHHNP